MFAGQLNWDEADKLIHHNLERWVALGWQEGPVKPPKGVPYGTHLATYIYCHPGEEIKGLNLCWLVQSSAGHFYRACEPMVGIEATWLFRYDTLKRYQITALAQAQVDALGFPNVEQHCTNTVNNNLRRFRQDASFDAYRHPGYPDDIAIGFAVEDQQLAQLLPSGREEVWARVREVITNNFFRAEMLNQPKFIPVTKGDVVSVRIHVDLDGAGLVGSCEEKTDGKPSIASVHPTVVAKLKERAMSAPISLRIVFEAKSQGILDLCQEIENTAARVNVAKVGSVAGCFCLAMCLAHEAPEGLRTDLEKILLAKLQLAWPDATDLWSDLTEFTKEGLAALPRKQRSGVLFYVPAYWVMKTMLGGKVIQREDELITEIAKIYDEECPGYWKAVQDYSNN